MSAKPDLEIPQTQKPSTVTIHETSSPIHIKLDGSNYRGWSQILEMHIPGRKKEGHITRRKVAPAKNDPSYDEWEAEDDLVKSWLINFMFDKLIFHFVQCGTTKDPWEAVWRSYHDVFDCSQVYEVIKKAFQLRQGGRPVAEYYNELNSIFLELHYRRPNDMTYLADIEKQRKRNAEDLGLDHSLDQVSGRVLAASPLPSLEETFSMVRCEEQRQLTMGMEDRSEASTLAVQKNSSRPAPPVPSSKHSSHFCPHCNSTKLKIQ